MANYRREGQGSVNTGGPGNTHTHFINPFLFLLLILTSPLYSFPDPAMAGLFCYPSFCYTVIRKYCRAVTQLQYEEVGGIEI